MINRADKEALLPVQKITVWRGYILECNQFNCKRKHAFSKRPELLSCALILTTRF